MAEEEQAPNSLHVEQMEGFVVPPLDPPPISVWDMVAASENTEQSAPVAAPAEQEN